MRIIALLALLLLAACGTSRVPPPAGARAPTDGAGSGGWSCVPYARARSGLDLRGDAWEWWEAAAASRLERGRSPRPGSVLVLMRTSRLPQGHVAVVSRVVSAREIRVDHANWASGPAKGREARDQAVLDVSPGNDWSLVRVWYPRVKDYGATTFPSYGFIHGGRAVMAGF
jgi:surface antigen